MEDRSVIHNTFVIERSYPATPEGMFTAFADTARKRRWFAESEGHEVEAFEMDFRTGGVEHARFIFKAGTPFQGIAMVSDTVYQDIVLNRRVVMASTMTIGDKRISASLVTVEFLPEEKGTTLLFTHQAAFFEGADGPRMREEGWRQLLDRLAGELTR